MDLRTSDKSQLVRLSAFLMLFASALAWSSTLHSTAQNTQDNRQLQRDSSQTNQKSQRRFALVIGNGLYQTSRLRNPPNDASTIGQVLSDLGFEVTTGTNKTQREMKLMIREFGQRLRSQGGVGLFYFAGHGVQAKGRNYLIPIDADIQVEADLEDQAVDVNYLLNLLDDAQNALNIVVLDACRNNPFARSFRSSQGGLAQVRAPSGTLIAYATSPDNTADDGSGLNSPYTTELVKQMRVPGVLVETMFRRVAEQVSVRTSGRQEPWFSANVKGDFYFDVKSSPKSNQIDVSAFELSYWDSIKSSNNPNDFRAYLEKYPEGQFVTLANNRIKALEKQVTPSRIPTASSRIAFIDKSVITRDADTERALEEFSKQNNVAVLVDSSLLHTAILASADGVDVTLPFVAQPKGNLAVFVPGAKIAVVDSADFYKEKSGLNGLAGQANAGKELDVRLRQALSRFARLNGITTILDTAKVNVVYASDNSDVTKSFIDFFNGGAGIELSQVTVPDTQIALINGNTMMDERVGLVGIVSAIKALSAEFQPLKNELTDMQTRANKLSGRARDDLLAEFERKRMGAETEYNKRAKEVLEPLYAEAGKAIEEFAKQRGITLVLDSSKISIVRSIGSLDKTFAFIAEYNQRYVNATGASAGPNRANAEPAPTPTLNDHLVDALAAIKRGQMSDAYTALLRANEVQSPGTPLVIVNKVRSGEIATINSLVFQDDRRGLRQFAGVLNKLNSEFEAEQRELNSLKTELQAMDRASSQFQSKLQSYTLKGQAAQKAYMERRAELLKPLQDKVQNELDGYAAKHGISIIVDVSSANGAVFATVGLKDVTNDFIVEFNQRFP